MTVAELQARLAALVADDPSVAALVVLTDGDHRTTFPNDARVIENAITLNPWDGPAARALEIA